MRHEGPGFIREKLHHIDLNLCRIHLVSEADHVGRSFDVSVDDESGVDVEGVAENDVCGLAADSRKVTEFFHRLRNFSVMVLDQAFGGTDEALALVAKEVNRLDRLFDILKPSPGQLLRSRVLFEKRRCYHVHPDIRTLR